jgi:hypothetical protein
MSTNKSLLTPPPSRIIQKPPLFPFLSGKRLLIGAIGLSVGLLFLFGMFIDSMEEDAEKRNRFEQEMTPLLALGNNIDHIQELKERVLDESTAWGRTTAEVADFEFRLQIKTDGLPVDVVKQLRHASFELSEATGEPIVACLLVLNSAWREYGGSVDSVQTLENKIFYTWQKTGVSFEEVAYHLPELLAAAKDAGLDINEVLATLIVLLNPRPTQQPALIGGRINPEGLETGVVYRVSEKTSLMPYVNPTEEQVYEALANPQYISPGGLFRVVGHPTAKGNDPWGYADWYRVVVKNAWGQDVTGYISPTALYGQDLERIQE